MSIEPIKYIVEKLINVIDQREEEKTRIMASSAHNYLFRDFYPKHEK